VIYLHPNKCVDVVLRAMPRILAAIPAARLRVVGIIPEAEQFGRYRRRA